MLQPSRTFSIVQILLYQLRLTAVFLYLRQSVQPLRNLKMDEYKQSANEDSMKTGMLHICLVSK